MVNKLTILFFVFVKCSFLYSQVSQVYSDSIYGLNPVIYNGKDYSFYASSQVIGHQFLYSSKYSKGMVCIKDQNYYDLNLNYDVYNQQLLLKYIDNQGAINVIEVSKAWLQNFSLNEYNFEYLRLNDNMIIAQKIEGKGFTLYLFWQKLLKIKSNANSSVYFFTDPKYTMYIKRDGSFVKIRRKKTFMSFAGANHIQEVKKYIKKNRLKIKNAKIEELEQLIDYCDTFY